MKHVLVLSALCLCVAQARLFTILEVLNYELIVAYPTNDFNCSCVGASCPGLKSSSLCGSDSSVNVNGTLRTLSKCMNKGTVCDQLVGRRPIPFVAFDLAQALPADGPITGSCTTMSNDFYVNAIPEIASTSSRDEFSLKLSKLALIGDLNCSLSICSPSKPPKRVNTLIPFVYNYTYSSLLSIADRNYEAKVTQPKVNVLSVGFGDFQFPSVPGYPDLLQTFTDSIRKALIEYSLPTAISNFYKNLFNSAFQVVANNCKH